MFVSRSIVGLKDFESIDCGFDYEFEIFEWIDLLWFQSF